MITSRRMVIAAAVAALSLATLSSPTFAERNDANDEAMQVELFEAIDAGQVDVKFIPHDASKANLLVRTNEYFRDTCSQHDS